MYDFNWPRAYSFDRVYGQIKQSPEDFAVIEQLPEEPSGDGEHLWVKVRKVGQNTQWLAKQIARWAGVKPRDVSYAGLKDRHAVTEQTFSVHLPGQADPSFSDLEIEGVTILDAQRHSRKLKTGQLIGNEFRIRIRGAQQHIEVLESNWNLLTQHGAPNYFGVQRFGHGGHNVDKGVQFLNDEIRLPRHQQGIYLSSVRSYLFNEILAWRIRDGSWNRLIAGDFVQFNEGKAGFYCEEPDSKDTERCQQGTVSPCGSLPGISRDSYPALELREQEILSEFSGLIGGLTRKKVSRHFRKLRVFPERPSFESVDGDPLLSFFLPAGSFATSVVAELCELNTGNQGADWHE